MKSIAYNSVPICLLLLAGFLAYNDKGGWGYCVLGAIVLTVVPVRTND